MQQVNKTNAVVFMQDCMWFLTFKKELLFVSVRNFDFFVKLFFQREINI